MDLLGSDSQSTPLETQFTDDTFSLEELGLSPVRETPLEMQPTGGRSKRKGGGTRDRGKGKGLASSSREAGAEEEDDGGAGRRTIWSVAENVALAKAWVGVVEDPYVGANQHITRMWHRISEGYVKFKPASGKHHGPEQCRKQWERLRGKLSRFTGIYQNNLRMATSGMSSEDIKAISLQQYPDAALGYREFEHWKVFLVVHKSAKFCAGVEACWPKRTKISASGEYSSSAGSHELPEAEAEIPTPQSSRRRRRPIGQKTAQRLARGSGSGSQPEVQSEANPEEGPAVDNLARAQKIASLVQTMERWHNATDPVYKSMLKDVIDVLRRDLDMPPMPDSGAGTEGGDDDE